MGTLFDSLQLNFDTTKFGDALDPRGTLQRDIILSSPPLTKWQYDAVATNNVDRTTYLKIHWQMWLITSSQLQTHFI